MKSLKSLAIAAMAIAGVATMGVGVLYAAEGTPATQNPMSGLVTAIAQKFNLNAADVQKVFEEQHQAMKAQHQAKAKENLDQAVKDGKLTQAQEDAIVAKRVEMKTTMEGLKDKTEAERKTAMDANRDSLKQWATQNNIPEEYLRPGHGRPGGGPGGRPGMGQGGQDGTGQRGFGRRPFGQGQGQMGQSGQGAPQGGQAQAGQPAQPAIQQ